MTAYYVDSNAAGANDGTSWTDAYADIPTALTSKAAGDIFYVASNHAETSASTINFPIPSSGLLNPVVFISASTAASPPTAYARGASVTATSTAEIRTNSSASSTSAVFIGLDFVTATTNGVRVNGSDSTAAFFDCTFTTSSSTGCINAQADGGVYFEKCEFSFGGVSGSLNINQTGFRAVFFDCKIKSGSSAITSYLFDVSSQDPELSVRGFDLTNAGAAISVLNNPTSTGNAGGVSYILSGLKMPTSWSGTILKNTEIKTTRRTEAYLADSANTIYQIYIDDGAGTVRSETTTVHTGTYDGTNKYSLKIACVAAAEEAAQPMYFQIAEFWAAANPTITVNLTSDSTLTDQDFWIEVESPDSTTGSLSRFGRTRNANYFLGTGTTLTTGSGWTSAKTNSYTCAHTVTSSQAGVHRVTAYLASDAAVTVYVDPEPVIT